MTTEIHLIVLIQVYGNLLPSGIDERGVLGVFLILQHSLFVNVQNKAL